ncbi:hypothetical protein [Antarctobacter heliothermus]|nr:hypothetical protein [Antarctobacter heliothermus]
MKRVFALVVATLVWAMPAMAQAIPDFDPSYVPSAFRMESYAKCGVRAAADPSWPTSHRRYVDTNGKPADKYTHNLGAEYWERDKRLGSRFTANPNVLITLTCNDTKLRQKFFDGMIQTLYDGARKVRGARWGKLSHFDAPGLGRVSYYIGSRKTDGVTDVAHAYFQHRGRNVSLMIQIGRTSERSGAGRKVRAGKVVELADNNGKVFRFRLTRPAKQLPLGNVGYIRTEAENQAFIKTILQSLRAM